MEFLARLSLHRVTGRASAFIFNAAGDAGTPGTVSLTGAGNDSVYNLEFNNGTAVFLGDPVFHSDDPKDLAGYFEKELIGNVIREVDGFYFLIVSYENTGRLVVTSGMFSILPVYYYMNKEELLISSSFNIIIKNAVSKELTVDQQHLVEKAIFNYPLFDRTFFNEIKTIASNSYIEYQDGNYRIIPHTVIHDLFISEPLPWRKACDSISELFIRKAGDFVPDEKAVVTLTGGFDSRTVLGIALGMNGVKATCTYGSPGEQDIQIASHISEAMGVKHLPVILNEEYAAGAFMDNAVSFLMGGYGLGNISRAHYCYALKTSLKDAGFLLSGNFGSELLRSMKVPGVVTSASLFDAFSISSEGELRARLLSNTALLYLNSEKLGEVVYSVVHDITVFKENLPSVLTPNQKFYAYLFGEVFRKYFGPEIMVQRPVVKHRAPFLCFSFIEAILKTGLAGANSRFLETNPLFRFQGQVLYATIMKKTLPALNDLRLDRGYAPQDLLTISGPLVIASEYFKKKYIYRRRWETPDYITVAF